MEAIWAVGCSRQLYTHWSTKICVWIAYFMCVHDEKDLGLDFCRNYTLMREASIYVNVFYFILLKCVKDTIQYNSVCYCPPLVLPVFTQTDRVGSPWRQNPQPEPPTQNENQHCVYASCIWGALEPIGSDKQVKRHHASGAVNEEKLLRDLYREDLTWIRWILFKKAPQGE